MWPHLESINWGLGHFIPFQPHNHSSVTLWLPARKAFKRSPLLTGKRGGTSASLVWFCLSVVERDGWTELSQPALLAPGVFVWSLTRRAGEGAGACQDLWAKLTAEHPGTPKPDLSPGQRRVVYGGIEPLKVSLSCFILCLMEEMELIWGWLSNRLPKVVRVPRCPHWKVIRIRYKLDSKLSKLKQKGKSVYSLDDWKYFQARPET